MEEQFYEEYARIEATHWWFEGRRAIFDTVLRSLDLPPNARLLDLGCGTGANLNFLTQYGRPLGLDRGAAAASYARSRTSVPVVRGDITAIPVRSNSVDLVTAFDIVEHVDDDRACAGELARVCRPGGYLMVTVPAFQWMWGAHDVLAHHKRRYRADAFARLFTEQGLQIQRFTYLNTLLFPVAAAVRGFRRLMPATDGELRSDFAMTKPGRMNTLLGRIFGAESRLIRHWNLPVGVSLLCVARKPEVS